VVGSAPTSARPAQPAQHPAQAAAHPGAASGERFRTYVHDDPPLLGAEVLGDRAQVVGAADRAA
jgi:hypothetical protein